MSPTQALFWKEWRQIQWRWIFCLAMCSLFIYIGLKTRIMMDQGIIMLSFGGCAFLIPLFIAMGLIAEEREQGCLRMQLGLPVTARQVYSVKMTLGALAVTLPILLSMVIALIMAANRERPWTEIIRTYAFAIPFGIIFVLWTVVFSINRKTQWAAALTGIAIMSVWVFLIFCEDMFLQRVTRNHFNLSLIITPFGFLEAGTDKGRWLLAFIVQGFLSMFLFCWGMKRFSMLTRSGK